MDKKGWIQNLISMLDRLGLSNLMQNILTITNEVISLKKDIRANINFFKN